ncbi:MAG: hypothetical protein J6K15_12590 [Lachnospiraceae bacterium]|nr:hypothetical protein [Lachnospiraceae bacterium]
MELKYPKISSGIKLIYVSWWCTLLGVVASLVEGFAAIFAGGGFVILVELAAGVLELLVYGLQVAGLYKAGKDEERYKKLFYMLVTELLIAATVIVAILLQSYMLIALIGIIGGLTCMVLESLRLCLFVKYTEELVQENGDAGVDGYYKTIRNCFFVAYGGILIGSFITAMEVLTWLGVLLIVVSMLSVIAMFIFYGIFLRNTNRFFKTLRVTEVENIYDVE